MAGTDVQPHAPCFGPHNLALAHAAPRCGARTRGGSPCRQPAVRGKARCRMHGGVGAGAPVGNRNAWKHGGRSAEALAERAAAVAVRRRVRELLRAARELLGR